jgi:polynucleotide 5'-hydroxyl-kinase GRC3/NOL9
MEIVPGPLWEDFVQELLHERGTVVLLGAVDSGKSTLAKYVIGRLVEEGVKAALVDCDIGQSTLGPPGTISRKRFAGVEDLGNTDPDRMYFVGGLNPAKKIPAVIDGSRKMVESARMSRSHAILVDTDGLIDGNIGKTLKQGQINAMKPDRIIAVEKSDELEHILSHYAKMRIRRLNPSRRVKVRSREARVNYRERKYREYFTRSLTHHLKAERLEFFYEGDHFHVKKSPPGKGTLLGLNEDGRTLAVGVLEELNKGIVTVKTPLRSIRRINRILVGDIVL